MRKNTCHPDTVDEHLENNDYQDTGCQVVAHCLSCPLPKCIHDDPGWTIRIRRQAQDLQVMAVIQEANLTTKEAVKMFSITERTVFRIMRRYREEELAGGQQLRSIP